MPDLSIAEQQKFDDIQSFGEEAASLALFEEGSLEELQESYDELNSSDDENVRRAAELELQQLGLSDIEIDEDGTITFNPSDLSDREMERSNAEAAVRAFTGDNADRLRDVARLTDSGDDGDSQVSLEDIEAALSGRGEFTEEELRGLVYLRDEFNSIDNDDFDWDPFDTEDISSEDIVAHAESESGVDADEVYDTAEDTDEEQRELVREAEPASLALDEYEVRAGDGFDIIARRIYMDAYDERPSISDELKLSEKIAELNDNDREYSGGYIHPGDMLRVPSLEEMEEMFG